MLRIVASFVFLACMLLVPAVGTTVARQSCMDACRDQAVACEAQRCGTGVPNVDSTCGRVCGDRYKQCKDSCPQ